MEADLSLNKKMAFSSWGEEVPLNELYMLERHGYVVCIDDSWRPTQEAEKVVRHYAFKEYPPDAFSVEFRETTIKDKNVHVCEVGRRQAV